jgi:peptidoglycan/xylan/chitin deacetylase (PgdA/CDA1 family)
MGRRLLAACAALAWGSASEAQRPVRPPASATHGARPTASAPAVPDLAESAPATSPAPAPNEPPRFHEPLAPREKTRAIVLLYHAFNRGAQQLSLKSSDFERQLEWMENNHVEIVSTSELLDFLEAKRDLPERVAVITLDDGLESVYRHAWPILKRHKTRFTLGLPTGMIEHPRGAPVMSWDQVREMVASGLCEVASHGHMHRRLKGLSGRLLHEEVELSRDLITERIGAPPVAYFYPLGAFDPASAKALRDAGYRAAFRASGAPIAAGSSSPMWLPRLTLFRGESWLTVANYFTPRFLGQVSYDPRRDRPRPSP